MPSPERPRPLRANNGYFLIPLLLPLLLFALYSIPPLLDPDSEGDLSMLYPDRLQHQLIPDALTGPGPYPAFRKYGVGAHLLDWAAVRLLLTASGEQPAAPQYEAESLRLSRTYHRLLAALAPLLLLWLLRPHIGQKWALLAALLFGLHPSMFHYGQTPSVNVPFLFFSLAALLCLEIFSRRASWPWAVLLGLSSACAFVSKEYFGLFMLGFPAVIWDGSSRQGRPFISARVLGLAALAFAVFLAAAAALSLLWLDPQIYIGHLHYWLKDNPGEGGISTISYWNSRAQALPVVPLTLIPGLVGTLHSMLAGLLALGGLYFLLVPRWSRIWSLGLPGLIYFFVVCGRLGKLFYPYFLPFLPVALAAIFVLAKVVSQSRRRPLRIALSLALCLIAASYVVFTIRSIAVLNQDGRLRIARYFRSLPRTERPLFTVGMFDRARLSSPIFGQGSMVVLDERGLAAGERPQDVPDYLLIPDPQSAASRRMWSGSAHRPEQAPELVFGASGYALVRTFEQPQWACVPDNLVTWYLFRFDICPPAMYLYQKKTAGGAQPPAVRSDSNSAHSGGKNM